MGYRKNVYTTKERMVKNGVELFCAVKFWKKVIYLLKRFIMNGYLWKVYKVPENSQYLMSRNGMTVATTDPNTLCIYLSENLYGSFLQRVLIHELGHCALFSFGLLDDIHRMVKKRHWIEAEEWACNFIADYGSRIFSIAYSVLGNQAIHIVPYHLERMIA